jgi:hypothetical protein
VLAFCTILRLEYLQKNYSFCEKRKFEHLIRVKRKKIYYVPGAISLLGLPFLFLFLTPKETTQSHFVRFTIPSDEKSDYNRIIGFSRDYFYKSIKGKKIIQIDLNRKYPAQETYLFNAKLNFISREIERLEFTNDNSAILKIKLGAANTYGHFMWVLNQALIYRLKRYALVDDSFYLFANLPPDRMEDITE